MQDSTFRKWVSSKREKFLSSKSLLKESKNDPPENPYKSKYEARDILSNLLCDLERQWKKEDDVYTSVIWGILKYELGVIALETEEYSTGCDHLTECWEVLKELSMKPEASLLVLNVLNQLGILWSGRGEPSNALTFLLEAEKIYNNYKANCAVCPCESDDMFRDEIIYSENWEPYEKTFTLTLYYLAQVYEHLNESEKSAKYCHMTLKKQKEHNVYDEKEWSINCATLSQYYIQEKMFMTARHLLACSTYILTKYESSIDNKVENEEVWDDIHRGKAEVAWCWLKYCINLLVESQSSPEANLCESLNPTYKLLDEENVHEIEDQVPYFVSEFEEARKVFLFGQNQIKEVKTYYTLSDHANNHVQLIRDNSKLYKSLLLYEADLSRQCKMHKRRIDMLEDVLSKLNPQYYLAVCRQLKFELGETYYELIDLKLKIINSSPQNNVLPAVKKVNSLIVRAIDNFKTFIDSLKDRDGLMPKTFEDDLVRPTLIAHSYLGGLYLKLVESDTVKKLQNLSKSEENYKYIINYTEKNPSQAHFVEKELPVVKEMIELMPEKIIQVRGSTMF